MWLGGKSLSNDKPTEFCARTHLGFARLIRASIQLRPCGGCVTKTRHVVIGCINSSNDDGQSFQTGLGVKACEL